jgi:guanine deaminase
MIDSGTYIVKSLILFILVLFGAYAQHSAESGMKTSNEIKSKIMELRSQITSMDHEYMKRAIALSHVAVGNNDEHPFGSVVVKDSQVIGEGWNRTNVSLDPSAHAEVEAIRDACKKSGSTMLNGATIYTSAEPCPMCLSLIYLTGIQKIYYCIPGRSFDNVEDSISAEYIYKALSTPQLDRPVQEIQIMQEEVARLLNSYKNPDDRVL